jgi:transcriptional regulator with XRE-family HTH domain
MARRRITQAALAQTLGMSQATVSRRLRGSVPFTVSELDQVARVLAVPAASLLGEGVAA